jgi:D-glycero-D-manno-heptose 1,7-bisphosphate phosphatase
MKPGAFLDRDGTLIDDAHYLADASRVRVVAGALEAVRALIELGGVPIIVTNQSGIARGQITPAQYEATRERVEQLFRASDAPIAATFHCPHHPEVTGPCACRKPGTQMYRDAAARFSLDLARSLYVGDRQRDVEPSLALGGFGVLVPSADTPDGMGCGQRSMPWWPNRSARR